MPKVITPLAAVEFRDRLCDAAAALFDEKGVDGFNMRELAKRLGVSPMTAYRHFKDKDDILDQLRTRGFARLADALCKASLQSGASTVLRAYVQFALEEAATYRLMFDLFQRGEASELLRHQERVRSTMNEIASAGDALWSALHGVVALHLAGKIERGAFEYALNAVAHLFSGGEAEPFLNGWQTLTAAE